MTKPHFIKDLAESHGSGHSDVNPGYNHGRGSLIRGVVEDYDNFDDLPRRLGNKGRFGWDRRDKAFKWSVFNRWLMAQVGRHVDHIIADATAFAKDASPTSNRVRSRVLHDSWEGFHVRGTPKLITKPGYRWPVLALVSADGSHIYQGHLRKDDLYVNIQGILCKVSQQDVDRYDTAYAKAKHQNKKVLFLKGHYYYCLNGAWQELLMAKAEADRWGYTCAGCALCRKLEISWREERWALYGRQDLFCSAMRTLSKKEIKALLLDTTI